MAPMTPRPKTGGVRLPLVLLLAVLGSVAGAAIWLTLATDVGQSPKAASGPRIEVRLASTMATSEPSSKTTEKPHVAKQATLKQPVPGQVAEKMTASKRAVSESGKAAPSATLTVEPKSTGQRPDKASGQPVAARAEA